MRPHQRPLYSRQKHSPAKTLMIAGMNWLNAGSLAKKRRTKTFKTNAAVMGSKGCSTLDFLTNK